jgi:hypothetical protein
MIADLRSSILNIIPQSSTVNRQSSIINHQSSIINLQSSIVNINPQSSTPRSSILIHGTDRSTSIESIPRCCPASCNRIDRSTMLSR